MSNQQIFNIKQYVGSANNISYLDFSSSSQPKEVTTSAVTPTSQMYTLPIYQPEVFFATPIPLINSKKVKS